MHSIFDPLQHSYPLHFHLCVICIVAPPFPLDPTIPYHLMSGYTQSAFMICTISWNSLIVALEKTLFLPYWSRSFLIHVSSPWRREQVILWWWNRIVSFLPFCWLGSLPCFDKISHNHRSMHPPIPWLVHSSAPWGAASTTCMPNDEATVIHHHCRIMM